MPGTSAAASTSSMEVDQLVNGQGDDESALREAALRLLVPEHPLAEETKTSSERPGMSSLFWITFATHLFEPPPSWKDTTEKTAFAVLETSSTSGNPKTKRKRDEKSKDQALLDPAGLRTSQVYVPLCIRAVKVSRH